MAKDEPRYEFTTCWADRDFTYRQGQVVAFGAKYTPTEFPAKHGKQLLKGGTLKPVELSSPVRETAALG